MWWRRNPIDLYISSAESWWCDGETTLYRAAHDDLSAGLKAACTFIPSDGRSRHVLRVWLSGSLARPFLMPAASAELRAQEAIVVAQNLARSAADFDEEVRIWLSAKGQRVAVAVPEALLRTLRELKEMRWRVHSIRPLWSAMLAHLLKIDPSSTLVQLADTEAAVTLAGKDGLYRHVAVNIWGAAVDASEATLVRAQIAAAEEAEALVRKIALRSTPIPQPIERLPFGHMWEVA